MRTTFDSQRHRHARFASAPIPVSPFRHPQSPPAAVEYGKERRRAHRKIRHRRAGRSGPDGCAAGRGRVRRQADPPAPSAAPTTDGHTWRNVAIGGGGFIPGIVCNRTEPGLVRARTDIGGTHRWDESGQRRTPLWDHIGWDGWGHTGVASLATDPGAPDNVHAAVGSHTNDWDPANGAILRSADRGDTRQVTEPPFEPGGNMPGGGMGERLAGGPQRQRRPVLRRPRRPRPAAQHDAWSPGPR